MTEILSAKDFSDAQNRVRALAIRQLEDEHLQVTLSAHGQDPEVGRAHQQSLEDEIARIRNL